MQCLMVDEKAWLTLIACETVGRIKVSILESEDSRLKTRMFDLQREGGG